MLESVAHLKQVVQSIVDNPAQLWSWQAFGVFVGWMIFQALLERFLPAHIAKGVELSTKERLKYRINAHSAFWVSILLAVIQPGFSLTWLYDHYIQLATASFVFTYSLSVFLYVKSFAKNALLADGGQTGNALYDFFIGRELNPRIFGDFDLKCFCELRPGLIGWTVLNISMLMKQMELSQSGLPSLSMICVVFFQAVYVWDGLYQEQAILTTMDITSDGFGWMLAFGDLSWVPFTYTLQARYLVENDPGLPVWVIVLLIAANCIGFSIFRGANSEKDAFRRDPKSVPHLKSLPTKRGTRLLISGWWGLARKINYTGDWLMALSWCAFAGFNSLLPYFYAIYFGILLIHRAFRDDHACSLKYGSDWQEYKKHVPSLFIPYLI